ncbi:N-formylglutamate deformylase [Halomonas sp.]|uniref:N-formylglutamate deformylase n=1 Tax=Halomonas sp. TaxID=1486246 RepID=UPI0035635F68
MQAYDLGTGASPVLVSIPHASTKLTDAVRAGLAPAGQPLGDTDWHVPRLYAFLEELDVSVIAARYSRYVVDLNRPPDDSPLYAGATTGLFPETTFDGEPLFVAGGAPGEQERARCLEAVWRPYHECIRATLAALRDRHGYAVLFDAHSIRSRVPRLFDGRLSDLNLGTADGTSCARSLETGLQAICRASDYSDALNGRFKGGHITRHFGAPDQGIHAVQLELAQTNYMDETAPFTWRPERAAELQVVLRRCIEWLLAWSPGQA